MLRKGSGGYIHRSEKQRTLIDGSAAKNNQAPYCNRMIINILQSKLVIPDVLRGTIERRSLIETFDRAPEANLAVLIAPAGYGKTTAAQQIITRQKDAVKAWYHMDSSDADTDRFVTYLVAALQPVLSQFRLGVPGSDAHQTIEDIYFALEQYRGPLAYLVLDNWECVDSNADIASIPPLLARSGHDKLRLIIASRVRPSFKTRRAQSRGDILVLDSTHLAFSLPECQEALRLRFGRDIEDEVVERFWNQTSGWCVSIGLLPPTLPLSGFPQVGGARLTRPATDVFQDYFTEEVYDSLPTDLAAFLCETSLFDVLTVERCRAVVSSPEQSEVLLEQLGHSAIPHVVLEQRGAYRLHALARQAFRVHLERSVDSERFLEIFRLTADYYLKEELILEAVNLLMEARDHDRALELMDTKWSELIGQHGWSPVGRWLEALPPTYHERPAFIKTYSNVLNQSGDNKGAITFLQEKLSPDRFADDIESFGSLWANYWWARVNTEPGKHYDAIVKAHDDLIATTSGFSLTMLGILQNTLGMAAHLELRLHEAIAHVMRAAELIEEPYARLRIIASQNVALYSHMLGRSIAALNILRQARNESQRMGVQAQISKMYMLDANIHLAMGHFHEALHDIDLCVAAMREHGGYSLQLDAYLGRFRGMILWYLGDRTGGLRLLEAARGPAREFNATTGMEVSLLYDYYSLLSDQSTVSTEQQEDPIEDSECRLMFLALQAIKRFLNRNSQGLKRYASQMCDIAQLHEMPQWTATGSFLLAMSLTGTTDKKNLTRLLKKGLSALSGIGWRTYPMANDIITSFVVVKAIRFGMDAAMINELLSTGAEIDLTPAFDTELRDRKLTQAESVRLWQAASRLSVRGLSTPLKQRASRATGRERLALDAYRDFVEHCALPPLRIEMLGGFSVSTKGRMVQFNRSSSRLLFQHLLVAYPRRMHEEELMEYVWPESEPAKSRANLRTAVKDLRRSLDPYAVPRGSSYVTYDDQHYGLALPSESRLDYIRFADLISRCMRKEASDSGAVGGQVSDFRQALEIYRGPLLPMLPYESFVIELRERLQALYQKGSLRFAELLIEEQNTGEAANVIERALEYDHLWTDGVKLLLHIHARRGETLKAIRVFRSYEGRMQSELGLQPDESVQRCFEQAVRSSTAAT